MRNEYYIHMRDGSGYLFMLMPGTAVHSLWPILYVDTTQGSNARRCLEEIAEADLPEAIRNRLRLLSGEYISFFRLLE